MANRRGPGVTTLTLVVPGLPGPGPADQPRVGGPPPAPALTWLLARAERRPAPLELEPLLLAYAKLPSPADADLPVAAFTRLADGGGPEEIGWWLRADPVYLRPDLRGVFLTDARRLAITTEEAAALTAAFNRQFVDQAVQLAAYHPERWYLQLPAAPGLRTWPLAQAVGRDVRDLLPFGPDKGRWHALLTETQMLFYAHPVNQARAQRRQPLINSLWLWGGGELPPARAEAGPPAELWWADEPLARGLAHWAGRPARPVPAHADAWRAAAVADHGAATQSHLVLLDLTRHDPADDEPLVWAEHVAQLERDWFAPCRRLLRSGQLQNLILDPGDGWRYALTSAARWRFWRRSPPPWFAAPPDR